MTPPKVRLVQITLLSAICLLFVCSCQSPHFKAPSGVYSGSSNLAKPVEKVAHASVPQLLHSKELEKLSNASTLSIDVQRKLGKLFTTPFLSNNNYYATGMPGFRFYSELGPSIRISSWNIEKSIHIANAAKGLASAEAFEAMLKPEVLKSKTRLDRILRQRRILSESDILILQEMDLGNPRSGYLFAAKHIAEKLEMNYVYAPQQIEVESLYESANEKGAEVSKKYRGLFGSAVLSKFPIKRTEIFQLKTQPYDWFEEEIKKADLVEYGRKQAVKTLFHFYPVRELKAGGRGFMRVDLHVPEVPHKTITIINVHLEIKTRPRYRALQLAEILEYIRPIKNTVILAGDFNSSPYDVSATSYTRVAKRAVNNPTNLFSLGMAAADVSGAGPIQRVVNYCKNFKDPLARNIPVLLPNSTKGMFALLETFRFDDGGAFDFRGDKQRSTFAVDGVLSNSNQRNPYKGFTYTFALPRPIGPFGRERLDWLFVKSFLKNPYEADGSYRLAPHFGETLSRLNRDVKVPFSDHDPISVLLPIREPGKLKTP